MNDPATVLVIDDDSLLVDLVTRKLEAHGFHVEAATDGFAGLARARVLKPDLIVLDQMMPKMDGREVLRLLRADPALSAVPVVMLTARRGESDVINALSLGASDFIPKPFSPDELAVRVQRLVPHRAAAG